MNVYARGKEPKCPVQGPRCLGIIRTRGALSCHPCGRFKGQAPPNLDAPPSETSKFTANGNEAELSTLTAEPVRTLADLIRVCQIDTSVWEVERWIANKWEMGSTDKDKKAHVRPLFQVKAWLKKKVLQLAIVDEIAALVADAKRQIPARKAATPARKSTADHMLEIAIPDLHVGKLAWSRETGEANYDSKIAEAVFFDALEALIDRTASYRFDQIVFPVGNDLLNADNLQGTTTRGTPQNTDSRYQKSFTLARQMMTQAIDRLRAIAPVHVLLVPGNHDTLSTWHLGDSLACYFHKTPGVVIDNEPRTRKYHRFGRVMLMFTHGDKGKRANYPLVMATEQPQMFGETIHREAHTGHLHQTRVEESHGVKVRISPALCPADAWHAENMYTGNARAAEGFVWHKDEGLVGTAIYTVPRRAEDAA